MGRSKRDMDSVRSRDGTRIAYDRSGDGPSLLLVHGAMVDHTYWQRLVPLLRPHFTIYAMDRRGRGGSGDHSHYAPEREVEDVISVVDAIDVPVSLFGHSSGAILAIEAACQSPLVRNLIVYEPPFLLDQPPDVYTLGDRLRVLLDAGNSEQAARTFMLQGPRISMADLERLERSARWPATVSLAHTAPYDSDIVGQYVISKVRLAGISAPTLLLRGSASPDFLRAATEALAAALPSSRVVVFEGQGHNAAYTAPEMAVGEILAFVKLSHTKDGRVNGSR